MLGDGKDPIGDETSDPGATEGTGEAPQGSDQIASSANAPGRPVEPRRGVAISTRSPKDPGRSTTPTPPSAGSGPAETAATAGAKTEETTSPGTEASAEAGVEDGAHLRGPWRPGPNPSAPWRPGPYPAWAYPPGTQPSEAQPKTRTHIRLFTALGAVVLLVGGLVLATVVLRQGGSSGPAATGGTPGTATIAATGTATIAAAGTSTPIASPEATSLLPTNAATRGPVTLSSSPAAGDGTVVFSDDFQNRSSGWPTGSQSGFMTLNFTSKGYVINATGGTLHHLVYSPSKQASQQLSMSLTAGLASASTGAGLGVTCRRGEGAAEISYALLVQSDGGWLITRRVGAPGLGALATTLSRGSSAVVPGATPITVVGMCASLGDPGKTRLVLFVDGEKIADMVDSANLPGGGWMGGLLVASHDTPAVATATRYEERDLLR